MGGRKGSPGRGKGRCKDGQVQGTAVRVEGCPCIRCKGEEHGKTENPSVC